MSGRERPRKELSTELDNVEVVIASGDKDVSLCIRDPMRSTTVRLNVTQARTVAEHLLAEAQLLEARKGKNQ